MKAPVQCRTFAKDSEVIPGMDVLLDAADPAQRERLLREAGLELLARNVGPMQRVTAVQRFYEDLTGDDLQLHKRYFSRETALKDCAIIPPDEAVTALAAARKAQLFDDVVVWSHPTTQESLLLGKITPKKLPEHYFKVAQWGTTLTTTEDLRRQQRFSCMAMQQMRRLTAYRPSMPHLGIGSSVLYGSLRLSSWLPPGWYS